MIQIVDLINRLKNLTQTMPKTMCAQLAQEYNRDPFIILVAALLSLRTRDTVTIKVVRSLLRIAQTPKELLSVPEFELLNIIRPVNYYISKGRSLRAISSELLARYDGRVPEDLQDLLSLPGVGRKTANLVLAEAFNIPAIAVDTHVHRLANELGLVNTKTPQETEFALQERVPKQYWREINRVLVTCGQNKCLTPEVLKELKHEYTAK
jgi:endonuclease III